MLLKVPQNTLVSLSGGLDSSTLLAHVLGQCRPAGKQVQAVGFSY